MNQLEFEQIFARVPLFADLTVGDFTILPLAGYTNHSFRLWNEQYDWVLRIPKTQSGRFIDREAEAFNQSRAEQLDIAPRVSWRDSDGITLTATLSSSRCLRAADFSRDEMLQAIVEPLRRLHRSGIEFRGRVNMGKLLSGYFGMLTHSEQLRLQPCLRQAEQVLERLQTGDSAYVASHNDLVLENLLVDESKLWIIDWEYSAMASPYWDLATLCNSADLDQEQSLRLMRVYCADEPAMKESLLFDYRGLLKMLSDCWMAALAKPSDL